MNRIFKTAAVVLCLWGSAVASDAQQPKVSVEMDSTYVTFGCPMTFHLQAIVPEGQQIIFPQDVLKHGGIVAYDDSAQYLLELDTFKPLSIDTVQQESGFVTLREDVTVFAFDSATFYIPPFEFLSQTGDTLRTNSLALKVFVPFESIDLHPGSTRCRVVRMAVLQKAQEGCSCRCSQDQTIASACHRYECSRQPGREKTMAEWS